MNYRGFSLHRNMSIIFRDWVVFSRKYAVPVYAILERLKESTIKYWQASRVFCSAEWSTFHLGDMDIRPFAISHDANEPSGYRIENGSKSAAVATDFGIYDDYTIENLKNLNGIVLEANHDIHMLEVGPYPYPLKRRVMGDKGHLSNELSGRLLCDILHDDMSAVVLGHLSKENNYESLAYETVKLEVTMGDNPYKGEELPITVAKRTSVSNIIQL